MLLLYATSHSQDNVISGKVTGTDKTPLQGVTVSVAGTKTQIWAGIDVDIPTESNNSKRTPQSVKEAVLAAFRAGAPGVILSRKYSEMRLANLSGARDAIRDLKLSS